MSRRIVLRPPGKERDECRREQEQKCTRPTFHGTRVDQKIEECASHEEQRREQGGKPGKRWQTTTMRGK